MRSLMRRLFARRAARRDIEVRDADDLMDRFHGYAAYDEARRRGIDVEMGRLVDPLRGRDHWHRVRSIIRKRIGYEPVGAGMRWPDP